MMTAESNDWMWLDVQQMVGLPAMTDMRSGEPLERRGIALWLAREGFNDPSREYGPDNRNGIWRRRAGKGGGRQYHMAILPLEAQTAWSLAHPVSPAPSVPADGAAPLSAADAWAWFDRLPTKTKDKAVGRLHALDAVQALMVGGVAKDVAVPMVAAARGVSKSSIWGWFAKVNGQDRPDWLPFLADRYVGRTAEAECSPAAWEAFKANYLRLEGRTATACYDDLLSAAPGQGWTVPSLRTLMRRLDREIPIPVQVLARDGLEALKKLYPAQTRRRDVFHALEAVNGDGHKFDVFVRWPDGDIVRPMMVGLQDVYSGKILAYRVDKSENREAIRLVIGDVVEAYGIPDIIYFDNTRAFANKLITGGASHRYRFKVKDEDPVGLVELLGAKVHFVTPYSGQSKPIERAWRDLADRVSTHAAFAGAYTGKNPMAKPENYGSTAVPLDEFLRVLATQIAAHNARPGRRTAVCNGRSFDEAFEESYCQSPIRKATPEQRRLWLLAAEGIRADSTNGSLTVLGNRFWDEILLPHRGDKLVARFDPQDVLGGLHVYDLAGRYLGHADVQEAAGFADVTAARDHARKRRAFIKATRDLKAAEISLQAAELANLLPDIEDAPPPETKVVAATFGNTALKPTAAMVQAAQADQDAFLRQFSDNVRRLRPVDEL